MEALQNYWWLLISILGGALVFMLFVQGGQTMIIGAKNDMRRNFIVAAMGHKWEITFTTLVVFGGAFFASFPLFYSTSFGGAYWLWMLLLFSFIFQAVSYEFREKQGNIYGRGTYDIFLFANGVIGCLLLGVAVSMFFFGAEFNVNRENLLNIGAPVISTWVPTHGFEAIFNWKNLILGVALIFLARMQAQLYLINRLAPDNIDANYLQDLKKSVLVNGVIFVAFFLWFLVMVLTTRGYIISADGEVTEKSGHYFFQFCHLWWAGCALIIGVVMVLYGLLRTSFSANYNKGIWWSGFGTVIVVCSLFWVAGYGDSAFYPSLLDPAHSLTIRNSSSTEVTLTAMSYVSILVPIILAYIAYSWYSLDHKKSHLGSQSDY